MATTSKTAPGPRGGWLLGVWSEWKKDPLAVLGGAQREYGDVTRFRIGPKVVHLLTRPEHIQRVLLDEHRRYGKQTVGWKRLREFLGNGLLTSEGSFWLRQRRIAQPAFHRQKIAGFGAAIVRAASDTLARWRPLKAAGQPVDMAVEMSRLTLRIVGETLMSADVSHESDAVGSALGHVLQGTLERISNPFLSLPLPTPANRRYQRALAELDRVVLGLIAARRRSGEEKADLMSMLMHARDEETGESMDDRQLRDEVMTIFLAGHETTANALSWTWLLLARHPDVLDRLRAELESVLGGRAATSDDSPRLPYTAAVIKESMRLYPPAWLIARSASQDDEIGGYAIPAGSTIMISPFLTHRRPDLWPNPEAFEPERFLGEKPAAASGFGYLPFGGGPRLCIGNGFALLEAQLVLATLAREIRPELVPGHPVELQTSITLRPKHGLKMLLR